MSLILWVKGNVCSERQTRKWTSLSGLLERLQSILFFSHSKVKQVCFLVDHSFSLSTGKYNCISQHVVERQKVFSQTYKFRKKTVMVYHWTVKQTNMMNESFLFDHRMTCEYDWSITLLWYSDYTNIFSASKTLIRWYRKKVTIT